MRADNTDHTITTRRRSSRDIAELLTAKELEALLKIDVKTIYSYVRRIHNRRKEDVNHTNG